METRDPSPETKRDIKTLKELVDKFEHYMSIADSHAHKSVWQLFEDNMWEAGAYLDKAKALISKQRPDKQAEYFSQNAKRPIQGMVERYERYELQVMAENARDRVGL